MENVIITMIRLASNIIAVLIFASLLNAHWYFAERSSAVPVPSGLSAPHLGAITLD
jgi:hypothetical protein